MNREWDGRWPICGRPVELRCPACTQANKPCYHNGLNDEDQS